MNDTTPEFKKEQMIWALSDLANINAGLLLPSEVQLNLNAQRIKTAVSGSGATATFLGNDFSVVWGPVAVNAYTSFKEKVENGEGKNAKTIEIEVSGFSTTNLMYVAKGKDPVNGNTMYVVATAGTNPVSEYGWFDEDLKVKKVQAWPPEFVTLAKPANAGAISNGSYDGLKKLWGMVDPAKGTLIDFLSETLNGTEKAEIATCGHSLGGALSPLVALSLLENQEESSKTNVIVSAHPSAGPSPGTSVFADYATKKFNGHYHSIVNHYDIVPHAWESENSELMDMKNLPDLYSTFNCFDGQGIPVGPIIDGFICWAKAQRGGNDYKRIGTDTIFKGKPIAVSSTTTMGIAKDILKDPVVASAFRVMVGKCGKPVDQLHLPKLLSEFLAYMMEAGGQHTTVYGEQGLKLPVDVLIDLNTYVSVKDFTITAAAFAKKLGVKFATEALTYFATHNCKDCQ